jgi:CHAT domain-containing protein
VLQGLGLLYASLSRYEQAEAYYNQALRIAQDSKDLSSQSHMLLNLGLLYSSQSRYKEAMLYYQQSVPLFSQIPAPLKDDIIEGKVMENLAFISNLLSKRIEAVEYYKKAISAYRRRKNRQSEGKVLFDLARVYSSLKQHDQAIYYYEQALPIYREYNTGIAEILFDLGNSYSAIAQYKKAIFYYEDLLSAYEESPNMLRAESHAGLLIQLSNAYSALSQDEKAARSYVGAIALFNATGRDEDLDLINDLGLFFQKKSHPELAIALYKKVVNSHEVFRQQLLEKSQVNLAFPMSLSDQQSRLVKESYTKNIAGTYRALASLLLQQNRVIEALQILDLLKVQDFQDFFSGSRAKGLSDNSIEMSPEEKKIAHDFQVLIENHLRPSEWLWKEFITNGEGAVFTAKGVRIQELASAKERQESQRRIISGFPDKPDVKSAIEALRQKASSQNLKLPAYYDLQSRIKKLGNRVALFYPLILDDRLELVILTADRPPIHKPIPISRQQLEAEVTTFRRQLQGRDPNIKVAAQKLYQSFIQPLEAELKATGTETIVYAPDDIMRYVPLAALHDGTQWLAERYQINYLTALALTPLDPDRNTTPHVLAAALTKAHTVKILDQTYNFSALTSTKPEVENLAKTLTGTTILIDNAFNRTNLSTEIPQNNILHLATHGLFVPNNPDESIILLGDGSTISLREIEQQWKFPNVSLVVLSACETAIGGQLGNGIEILGFGYQMQRTGSRASISSLWTVDDGGTQILMSVFYNALKQGIPKAQALQSAQKALITGNYKPTGTDRASVQIVSARTGQPLTYAQISHPYYWAPFILIGNGL